MMADLKQNVGGGKIMAIVPKPTDQTASHRKKTWSHILPYGKIQHTHSLLCFCQETSIWPGLSVTISLKEIQKTEKMWKRQHWVVFSKISNVWNNPIFNKQIARSTI